MRAFILLLSSIMFAGCKRGNDLDYWQTAGTMPSPVPGPSTRQVPDFTLPDLPKMFEVQTGTPSYPNYSRAGAREQPVETGITEIAIQRTWCLGSCPSYKATILADGTVEYEGFAHVKRTGKHLGKAEPPAFYRLTQFVHQINFFSLEQHYNTNGDAFDSPSCYVMVKPMGKGRVIKDHSGS